jgi:hypothetical protein
MCPVCAANASMLCPCKGRREGNGGRILAPSDGRGRCETGNDCAETT